MSFSSPYNFVSMADNIHCPDWQTISLDQPEEDGLSGTISYELTNHSPLLIGDERKDDVNGSIVNFFKTPDDQYAIPGTSIKGMIRSWLEIVTHARMSQINDTHLSFRDLNNSEYKDLLTESLSAKEFKAKSKAGWLKLDNGQWCLYPAQLWRIENAEIEKNFGLKIRDKQAECIYKKLKGIQTVYFTPSQEEPHRHSCGKLVYAKLDTISNTKFDQASQGYLIVIGQVSNKKHMNFVFSDPSIQAEPLSPKVIKSFLDINSDSDFFNYLKSLNHPNGIPVFYLSEQEPVSHIGLAQMFRLPYKYSVGELRKEKHQEQSEQRDFCELLFGFTDAENEANTRKGRVSFLLAKLAKDDASSNVEPMELKPTILGTPKSSFYPAYIDQTNANGRQYNTYNQNQAKLAGFKRYLVHTEFDAEQLPDHGGNNVGRVAVQLRPLPKEQRFTGKVHFHNLKPQELGSILFALNITQKEEIYHQLGMGKPLGLGKMKLRNIQVKSSDTESGIDVLKLQNTFEQYVEHAIGALNTLQQLLLMQSSNVFTANELAYLEFPKGFLEVKKSKSMQKLKDLQEKAKAQANRIYQEKERKYIEAKKAKQKEMQAQKYNQKTAVETFIQEYLAGEINKQALLKLEQNPNLYQALSETEQKELAQKIEINSWFKGLKKKRSKWRKALPDLFKGV